MPKKKTKSVARPFYKSPPPKRASGILPEVPSSKAKSVLPAGQERASGILPEVPSSKAKLALPAGCRQHVAEFRHPHFLAPAHFELREDGSIGAPASGTARSKQPPNAVLEAGAPTPSTLNFAAPCLYRLRARHLALPRQFTRTARRHRRQISRWLVRRHLCRPALFSLKRRHHLSRR